MLRKLDLDHAVSDSRESGRLRSLTDAELAQRTNASPMARCNWLVDAFMTRVRLGLPIDVPFDIDRPEVRLTNERQLQSSIAGVAITIIGGRFIFPGFSEAAIFRIITRALQDERESDDAR